MYPLTPRPPGSLSKHGEIEELVQAFGAEHSVLRENRLIHFIRARKRSRMRNAGFGARFGASRFHDDERLVQNQSPARGRLESLPVPGIFEIPEHQPDLRVLQQVLQIIGKTQHALVAGGDPVTKR